MAKDYVDPDDYKQTIGRIDLCRSIIRNLEVNASIPFYKDSLSSTEETLMQYKILCQTVQEVVSEMDSCLGKDNICTDEMLRSWIKKLRIGKR